MLIETKQRTNSSKVRRIFENQLYIVLTIIFMKFRELLNLILGFVFSASHGDNIFHLIKENQEDFKLHMM